ncbi:MAG: hypothetical protein RLZZ70_365 [Candidatus Parcubacteria bacterium]|jgi:hypothetical protein
MNRFLKSKPLYSLILKYLTVTAGLIILVYAVFLRLIPIDIQPYWMDEGYTINATLSYQAGKTDGFAAVLDSGQPYECFLYCYPTAHLNNIFGNEAWVYRILSVLFGMLSVFAIFYVTRALYTLPIAYLSAFFTLFAYFQIAWSTQARWYTLVLALFWTAIGFTLLTHKTTSKKQKLFFIVISLFCATLATWAHSLAILLFPTILITCLYYSPIKQATLRLPLTYYIATVCLLALLALLFRTELYYLLHGINVSFTLPYHISFLLREYWGLLPFIIFALVTAKRAEWYLLTVFLTYLIPLSFFTSIVHYRYLFYVTPVLYILAAVGVWRMGQTLTSQFRQAPVLIAFISIFLFFISPTGTLLPQDRYWLEADNPETLAPRPSYAYTPQPDWNSAYEFILNNNTPSNIIISSHPHFTKIFLNQAGYWISYDYLGLDNRTQYRTADDREYYVGAISLDSLEELKTTTQNNSGFIVLDYMTKDGRLDPAVLVYIETNFPLVFEKRDNSYSHIWVYRF